ncbi:hypothetical protein JKP88DRAFT_254114 [Tribonema minus]|uniref:Uncharacterized protein n=1 Tax=Tribonema minus TaxID=303371 RepID=A0A836CKZ1_9STRA|nr:hypothetical protein JKP88DRAFT_254114 [Tribonema minus]
MANPDANAYHRRAPSTTHWQPSAAAGDSQSSAATSSGPFIARNDLGSAAKASSSGDETLARGLAVDYPGTFNAPTRGNASIRSTSTGSVDGLFGHSEQQDVDRFDASPRSIRQATLISGRGAKVRKGRGAAHGASGSGGGAGGCAGTVRGGRARGSQRGLDRAEWCAEENKVRATNAEQLASHLANTISQHVLPQVDELQMRQTEVAQHAACEVQAVTDCVTSLTTRVDELMTSIAGLREAQATRFYTPASALQTSAHAKLCERNLRALGSSGGRDVSRRAVDVRSMLSAHAAQPSAAPARSVASAPAQDLSGRASSSSIAATIPVHAHTSQPDRYPSMVAAPEPLCGGDFASASRRSSLLDMLKPDARAQLDGAARQASQPHGRACFNCGSTDHGFVNCDADYNSTNWDAAVKRLPWVQRFKPHSDDDFKQLCARARPGISKGEQDDSQRARRARGCSSFTTAAAAAHHRSAVVNSGGISSSAPAAVDHGSSTIPAAAAAISSAHAQHCHTWNQHTRAGHGAGNGFHTAGTRTFLHTCIAIPVAAARAAAAPPQRAAALAGLRGGRICDFILCSCAGITHDECRAAARRIGASHVSDHHKHRGIARSRGGGGCPSYCGSNSSDGGASDGARYFNCHIDSNSCSKPSSTHFSGISLVSTSTSTAPTSTTAALWSARNVHANAFICAQFARRGLCHHGGGACAGDFSHALRARLGRCRGGACAGDSSYVQRAHRGLRRGAACTGDYTDTHSTHRGLRHGCAYAANCFCAQHARRAPRRGDACAQPGDFFCAQRARRGPCRGSACAGDFFCTQRARCGPRRVGACGGILFYAQHTSATCDTSSHTQLST